MPSSNKNDSTQRGVFWTFFIFLSTSVIYTFAATSTSTSTTGGAAFISSTNTRTRTTHADSNHVTYKKSSPPRNSISLQQNDNDKMNAPPLQQTAGMLPVKAGMPILPKGLVKYSTVPKEGTQFTATTIPRGLLKEHSTKKGTWGIIRVSQGLLEYTIPKAKVVVTSVDIDTSSDQQQQHVFELSKDFHGIIEPQRLHQVRPLTEDVEFVVEFMRLPNTGPVDEKREGL